MSDRCYYRGIEESARTRLRLNGLTFHGHPAKKEHRDSRPQRRRDKAQALFVKSVYGRRGYLRIPYYLHDGAVRYIIGQRRKNLRKRCERNIRLFGRHILGAYRNKVALRYKRCRYLSGKIRKIGGTLTKIIRYHVGFDQLGDDSRHFLRRRNIGV